jgi:hypothetical protein
MRQRVAHDGRSAGQTASFSRQNFAEWSRKFGAGNPTIRNSIQTYNLGSSTIVIFTICNKQTSLIGLIVV